MQTEHSPIAIDIRNYVIHTDDGISRALILTQPEDLEVAKGLFSTTPIIAWAQHEALRYVRDTFGLPWPQRYIDLEGVMRFLYPGVTQVLEAYRIKNREPRNNADRVWSIWKNYKDQIPKVELDQILETGLVNGITLAVDTDRAAAAIPLLYEEQHKLTDHLNELYPLKAQVGELPEELRHRLSVVTGLRCAHADDIEPRAWLNPMAADALKTIHRLSSLLDGKRRLNAIVGHPDGIPFNYTYASAATLRWSCRGTHAGDVNLLALPKSNRLVGEPIRKSIQVPEGWSIVAGDLAQVDYRGLGYLAGCDHVINTFSKDPFADPYLAYWRKVTGQDVDKDSPARKVAKAQVLSAMYLQGVRGACTRFVEAGITEEMAADIVASTGWRYEDVEGECEYAEAAGHTVAHQTLVANARREFLSLHHEIVALVDHISHTAVGLCMNTDEAHRAAALSNSSPNVRTPFIRMAATKVDENHVDIGFRIGPEGDEWNYAALKWLSVAYDNRQLTYLKDGRRTRLTRSVICNNIGQCFSRQLMVNGMRNFRLAAKFPCVLPAIHDQALVICPTENTEEASALLASCFDPHKTWWACMPDPIAVTQDFDLP